MKQQTNLTLSKDALKKFLRLCFLMVLTLGGFIGKPGQADSTFFPDDSPEATTDNTTQESSNAIKEWAELKPAKKEAPVLVSQKEERKKVSLAQPPAAEKKAEEKQEAVASMAVKPDSKAPSVAQAQQPAPTSPQASAAKAPSAPEKQKPLQLTKVEPHPKALPVHEKVPMAAAVTEVQKAVVSYADAANDRAPLAILEPKQEVQNQKWYIYSSAIRGLKNPSDRLQIVSMEGTTATRGQQVKNLLVEMGIEAEKIQLVHAKGEENQVGTIYIFSGS